MRTAIVVAGLLALTFFAPRPAWALTLAPEAFDLTLSPGQESIAQIVVLNDSPEASSYDLSFLQVEIGEGVDDLTFASVDDEHDGWFVAEPQSFTLQPLQEQIVNISVLADEDAEDQVYVVGVRVDRRADPAEGIEVQTGVISLGFLTIGDGLDEDVRYLAFSSDSSFLTHLPAKFSLTLRNEGERVVQPTGTLTITSLFGRVVETVTFNPDARRVASGQTRTLSALWGEQTQDGFFSSLIAEWSPLTIGLFEAHLQVQPWEGAETHEETQRVTIVPVRTIILVLIVLGALALSTKKRCV